MTSPTCHAELVSASHKIPNQVRDDVDVEIPERPYLYFKLANNQFLNLP